MLRNQIVMVANRCNLSCTYCWYEVGSADYLPDQVEVADYERWFAACARDGALDTVSFTGGEPLLRADIVDLLEAADRHAGTTMLFTNGTLLDEDTARVLARLGTQVHISIDHVDLALADRVRGGTKVSLRALEQLSAAGVRAVQICMVVTSRNWTQVPAMARFAQQRGHGLELIPVGVPDSHPLSLRTLAPDQLTSLLQELRTWSDLLGRGLYYRRFAAYVRNAALPVLRSCRAGDTGVFITSDGGVTVCAQRSEVVLGNIRTHSPEEVRRAKQQEVARRVPGACVKADCLVLV
ncbi:radical SAM protein [Streptomyces sp. CL12]|uniref:radical SAM protein n=1 Tax=Streptomyces sp. CL12 TaxID=3391744 RepID=UPI003A801656